MVKGGLKLIDKKEITIIQMNDTHGYLEEHYEHFWDGSFAKYINI